jgi:UDP-N-acetylglucosamine acyltransferase
VTRTIHPTALVDPRAELGDGVEVGPFAIIGPDVIVGDGCRLAARVTLERYVRLAGGVQIGEGSVLGSPPQDFKYKGEETWVEVGADTVIREYSTINRATVATGRTVVGAKCFFMTYVHIAHDCRVGDTVVIANGTLIAGHVTIHDNASVGGLTPIGPFILSLGYVDIGSWELQFTLGRPLSEGSMLDELH